MRKPPLIAVVTVVLVLLVMTSGIALAKARGNPELDVAVPDNEVSPGDDTTLELFLQNAGDVNYATSPADQARVTTARDVSVTLTSEDAPIEVNTGRRPIGNLPEGVSPAIPFSISVAEDAEPGEYTLTAKVRYTYTQVVGSGGQYDDTTRGRSIDFTVVVTDDARFSVIDASATDLYGTSGPVTLTLRNVGTAAASDATVTVRSGTSQLTFGNDASVSTFVGNWTPGTDRTVTVEGRLAPGANRRSYPLVASIEYEDVDGESATSESLRTGVVPRIESRFSMEDVQSTLAVGREGRIRGTVVNDGRSAVRNAVLVLRTASRTLEPTETEYSLGDLEAGKSKDFTYDIEVSETASGGPRQLSFVVQYRDASNEVTESDSLDARVDVGPDRNTFDVAPVTASVTVGGSQQLEVEVTNQGDEPVTSISAKLFANSPLSADDDEAFIDRLAPGESDIMVFSISADEGALEKTYPVSMDFQYDDADGDTLLSDTYQVPVAVNVPEGDGGGLPIVPIIIVLVVLAGAGYLVYRRRQPG